MPGLPSVYFANREKLNGSVYFRKEFEIKEEVLKAELLVCALGLGVCTLNGKRVGDDVLSTPFTHYDKRLIYQNYDITDLVSEKNAIGLFVGNGFYCDNMSCWEDVSAPWKDNPKVAAVINITFESGETQSIPTDKSWKCTTGASVYNHMRQGEIFDARIMPLGFDSYGFDDSGWSEVKYTYEPGGILEPMEMPPIRIIRELEPVRKIGDTYDFGENISGWAKIRVSGERGQEISVSYDETIDDNGNLYGNVNRFIVLEKLPKLGNKDIFICSGREKEEWHPEFCYHGFRYIKVENAPEDFKIIAQVVHTDLKKIGNFRCNDEMLNKIHDASVRATLTNYHGIPTDCPHREQNGWTGDAQLSSNQALMNFDIADAYKKWMKDVRDTQRPNGQVSAIAPNAGWGYNVFSGPAWDCVLFVIPWNVYVYTGRTDLLAEGWDAMVRHIEYMERMSENYIVDYGLGDWCTPDITKMCPVKITSTAYFYYCSVLMSKIARVLGFDDTRWCELAQNIRKSWRSVFWQNEGFEKYQTFYACAIYFGLLNEDEIPIAAEKLMNLVVENDYHIDCGVLGTKCIFSALSDNGYIDTVYKMVTNPTAPSYAYWILNGCTTLCENWLPTDSRNHHMFSEVDNWFYRYVGGIRITEEGVIIQPYMLEAVSEVDVSFEGIQVSRKNNRVFVALDRTARVIIGKTNDSFQPGSYEFEM